MKVVEVFDEFENQPITRKHLDRVQAARCQEFVVFFNAIMQKYTDDKPRQHIKDFINDHFETFMTPEKYHTSFKGRYPLVPPNILDKLMQKFTRMLLAKRAFEEAGGKYKKPEAQ